MLGTVQNVARRVDGIRSCFHVITETGQDGGCRLDRIHRRGVCHNRTNRMQPVSKSVTIPKFPPPPRSAQKRIRALGVARGDELTPTRDHLPRAGCRRSCHRYRRSHPWPPPSVRPAIPVVETTPPGTARPNACVSRSRSPHVTPACARTVRFAGSTWMPSEWRKVDDEAAVTGTETRHVMPAAANRDEQIVVAREPQRLQDVRDTRALHDHCGPLIDEPVPDTARPDRPRRNARRAHGRPGARRTRLSQVDRARRLLRTACVRMSRAAHHCGDRTGPR